MVTGSQWSQGHNDNRGSNGRRGHTDASQEGALALDQTMVLGSQWSQGHNDNRGSNGRRGHTDASQEGALALYADQKDEGDVQPVGRIPLTGPHPGSNLSPTSRSPIGSPPIRAHNGVLLVRVDQDV